MDRLEKLKRVGLSITGRMILGIFMIHILLTPLLFYGIVLIVERSFESQFVNQVRNDALLYSELLRPAVEAQDTQRQVSFLHETQFNGDVIFAEIHNIDEANIRADTNGTREETVFREDFYFGGHDDQIYFIAAQLFSDVDGRPLGTLRLGYDELPVREQINAAYRYGSFIAACYIVFSILLAIFFGRHLIRPVSSLRKLATSIAAGNQTVEFHVNTNIPELKSLTEDLEVMHQSLIDKQKEILDRELRLNAILNNAGEGIVTIDENGIIQSFNLAAESIFGYTGDQILGRNVSVLMSPPHSETHNDYIEEYLRTGVAKIVGTGRRVQARRRNGEIIPIFLTISKVQQGQNISFTGIMRDLSGEEKREAELQQLSRAVEQSPVSIMITNAAGNIEYVNPSFYHITEYSQDDVIGENPRFLRSDQTSEDTYADLWGTISKGGIWRGVFQNRKKNGDFFWLSSTVCPVRDQDGEITHYISISEDITDAREKESMLTQAMKLEAIGRMTDGISHDFNNLLTVIRGNLRFLKQDLIGANDDHRELIEDALSAAQDGADLIKRLLAFSRRQELDVQAIDINSSLAAMERIIQRSVPEISIKFELDSEIGNVLVDAVRLESAVLNMVTNARDAMLDGGNLVISTTEETVYKGKRDDDLSPGNYIVLTVTDDGIGMNDETRRQAIEPFFTTKSVETGTGLGLTMVSDFVQQCGGKLYIKSAPNKGTSIRLLFPSIEATDDLINEIEVSDGLPTGEESILVVEDRERVRRFACRTLERLGYETREAENAAEAMKLLRQHQQIDLLFTDIVMPGDTNGRELANIAKKTWPAIKVLLTTGMEPENKEETRSLEDVPLLPKPYSSEQLARRIRAVLDTEVTN